MSADTTTVEQADGVLDLPRIPDDFVFEDDQLSVDYYQISRDFPEGTQLTCQSESCSVAWSSVGAATNFIQHVVGADQIDYFHKKVSYIDDLQPVIDISCLPSRCFRGMN